MTKDEHIFKDEWVPPAYNKRLYDCNEDDLEKAKDAGEGINWQDKLANWKFYDSIQSELEPGEVVRDRFNEQRLCMLWVAAAEYSRSATKCPHCRGTGVVIN